MSAVVAVCMEVELCSAVAVHKIVWNVDPSWDIALHAGGIVSHAGASGNSDGGQAGRIGDWRGRGLGGAEGMGRVQGEGGRRESSG